MPQQTKVFRVFVSSTFSDMTEERRLLQRNVFPRLEKFCEERGAKFQAVDLRWGVTEESQLNQKTLEICLNEIVRCQKISPRPNFLLLLGNRYGWQPVPARIPDNEMEKILQVTLEKELLNRWYKLDENSIPPEYILQPRSKELSDSTWGEEEKKIQSALRDAVSLLQPDEHQRIKYFASATHQEIIAGALNPTDSEEKPEEHVLAMIRETEGMPTDGAAKDYVDLIEGEPDSYSIQQLNDLKSQLRKKLDNHCISYEAAWHDCKTSIKDPVLFGKEVYDFLEGIISEQINKVISRDEIEHEKSLHKEFRTRLTENFCGRNEILETLKTYLNNQPERKVLAMVGASGSGKSSVMAKATLDAEACNTGALNVYRFIGTSSRSSNIISLLQSVCEQIAGAFGTNMTALAGDGQEKTLYDLNGLTEILKKCLALGTGQKPVILFLDALDQLSDSDNARSLYWLPRELPEHARVVVSALPELEARLSNQYVVHLPLLPPAEAEQILGRWLKAVNRTLTPDQHKELTGKFNHSGLPIYLKLAFEQAKRWKSYTEDFTLKEDVNGIINNYIDMLEIEHTRDFVQDVICLMLCGRYQGLAENEILEIFAFDKDLWDNFLGKTHPSHRHELVEMKGELKSAMKIPIVVWSRLYLDLEPYLTERDADGVPIITFFHRQFNEVLRERYLLSGDSVVN
jgi:hypothetical protein